MSDVSEEPEFGTRVPTQPVPIEYQVLDIEEAPGVKLIRIKTHSGTTEVFLPPENARDLAEKLTAKPGDMDKRPARRRAQRLQEKLILPPTRLITPPERT